MYLRVRVPKYVTSFHSVLTDESLFQKRKLQWLRALTLNILTEAFINLSGLRQSKGFCLPFLLKETAAFSAFLAPQKSH